MSNRRITRYFFIIVLICASFAAVESLTQGNGYASAPTGPELEGQQPAARSTRLAAGSLQQPATGTVRDHKRPVKKDQPEQEPSEQGLPKKDLPRIAILPFENLSGQFGASEQVMADITASLQKEFSLVSEDHVEIVLSDLRIRHTGFLTTGQINEIGRLLKVDTVLLGIIDTYRREPLPQVSFFCNLVSTKGSASTLWSKYFSAVGRQKVYLLQRDNNVTWSSIMQMVTEDLLRSLPKSKER
jgi:TolB-like protein